MNWYYAEGTQQRGPISEAELQQLAASGNITDATLVWREGMAQWQPYGQVKRSASAPGTATPPLAGASGLTPAFNPQINDDGARRARDRVNGPAIGLIATAVIGFVVAAGALVQAMLGTVIAMPPDFPPEFRKMFEGMTGAIGFVNAVFAAALSTVILMGGLKLRKLQSFGLCIAAAIIALVPCISPCCCIGLPVGIWVLVVMNSADVKPYFD